MANKRKPAVPDELLDQLLAGTDALEAFRSGDLVQDLKKALAERILNAELDHHLDDGDEQVQRQPPQRPQPQYCVWEAYRKPTVNKVHFETKDVAEGIKAVSERRPAIFTGKS